MSSSINRRQFVTRSLQAGAVAGLGNLAFLNGLPPVAADEAKVAGKVQLSPDIEPLVRLIEDTQRDKLLEAVATKVKDGSTSYQQLLTAVMLAGVRGIKPRPVGFKFHAVLVINSANLAALAAPDSDRWLPLFWAIDNFKSSQARNAQEGNWVMPPAKTDLPATHQAKERFVEAMDKWDEEGADRAISAWVRDAGATEVIETFWRYGARDFRDIGHKAIYVANAWRTLQTIGWRHAEPVMRSLAFALLEREGSDPAKGDAAADVPGRENLRRAQQIRGDWRRGKVDAKAATDLLQTFRSASAADASTAVVDALNKEISPASVWDALFLYAGELLMCQPGIVGIHCVTSTNALHYGYETTSSDETRRLLMLQNAAFLPLFRDFMQKRGKMRAAKIDVLEKDEVKAEGPAAIEAIFSDMPKDRDAAARKTLALAAAGKLDPEALMTAARRLIFLKGTDSHDYKFSSAALEDYYHVTPAWRGHFLATSMFNLRGAGDRDNNLVKRTRAALGA